MSQAEKKEARLQWTQAVHASALLCTLAASASCNWTEFDTYEKDAPIRVHDTPTNYRKAGYGGVLTAFSTDHSGTRSLAVASAGPDSPVVFTRLWNGKSLIEDTFTRCKQKEDCDEGVGVGSALIPFPHWALGTVQQLDGCVFSPGLGKAYVFCDSNTNANQSFDLELGDIVDDGNLAGFSGAGLPSSHPLGVFLFAAYQISSRTDELSRGRVFYQLDFQPEGQPSQNDKVPPPEEFPLRDPVTGDLFADDPEAGDLGFAMAATPGEGETLMIAVGQPSRGRVIVALYDDATSGGIDNKLTTVACIDNPGAGGRFGARIAMADINGDGWPEIAIGSEAADSSEAVYLYRGEAVPTPPPAECPAWPTQHLEVTCSEGVREVGCANSAFGAALAFGDVNGDGASDLLVGAPRAEVSGKSEAGAVWLFAGNAGRRGPLLDLDGATPLHADNKERAHLGSSVAAVRTADRDEPVAGAPDEDRLFTFMCSELEDDVSGNTLCLPK
jgi:hypothetical protein